MAPMVPSYPQGIQQTHTGGMIPKGMPLPYASVGQVPPQQGLGGMPMMPMGAPHINMNNGMPGQHQSLNPQMQQVSESVDRYVYL